MSPSITIYEARTSIDRYGDTKVCLFKFYKKNPNISCWVPSHIGIRGNERPDQAAKSALYLSHATVGVLYNDFRHCINIFSPPGKMIGMVQLRTSFILSSQFWEIDSPPTGGAGRIQLLCVVPASVIQFATFWWSAQERKYIFGRRDVLESFRFHPTLIILFLKQIEFYYKCFNNPNCDKFIVYRSLHCIL